MYLFIRSFIYLLIIDRETCLLNECQRSEFLHTMGHSLQTYLNIVRERLIQSVIQIEKSADVAKCKRAMF